RRLLGQMDVVSLEIGRVVLLARVRREQWTDAVLDAELERQRLTRRDRAIGVAVDGQRDAGQERVVVRWSAAPRIDQRLVGVDRRMGIAVVHREGELGVESAEKAAQLVVAGEELDEARRDSDVGRELGGAVAALRAR